MSASSAAKPHTNPKPHKTIEHTTIIDASVDDVWRALIDVNDWRWNRWTKLEAGTPAVGLKGTLRACYEGDDRDWMTFRFEFAEVDPDRHVLAWKGEVGPFDGCLFRGYHTMRLEPTTADDDDRTSAPRKTRLVHREVFGGLLPTLRCGLPYAKLDRNYRLMNEALKEHVEAS